MTIENMPATNTTTPRALAATAAQLHGLQGIADRWRTTGSEPPEAGPLSGGEYRAVCLVARKAAALRDPVGDFLVLDGWLQRWVLEQLGMTGFVGQRVGVDESI